MISFPNKTMVRHRTEAGGAIKPIDYVYAYCLTTDTKPVDGVANGSWLYEIDSGTFYCFNEEHKRWIPLGGGS